jgi:hypothetical protein
MFKTQICNSEVVTVSPSMAITPFTACEQSIHNIWINPFTAFGLIHVIEYISQKSEL